MSNEKDPLLSHRPSEEGDWVARQFLSPTDLLLSPEEYAARSAHLWGCFSLHRYKYADPDLGAWIRRLAEILSSEEEIERCRRRFLRPEERAEGQREEAKDW